MKWPDFHAECFFLFEMSKFMCCASSPYCEQIPHLINPFGIGKHFVVTLYVIFHLCGYCVSKTKGLKALFHPLVTRKNAHEPAMYSCSLKMLSYPTLYRRKCSQQMEWDDSSLLSWVVTRTAVSRYKYKKICTCWSWSRRAAQMIRRIEHLCSEERLRELGLLSWRREASDNLSGFWICKMGFI